MVLKCSRKPTCAPTHLSQVSQILPSISKLFLSSTAGLIDSSPNSSFEGRLSTAAAFYCASLHQAIGGLFLLFLSPGIYTWRAALEIKYVVCCPYSFSILNLFDWLTVSFSFFLYCFLELYWWAVCACVLCVCVYVHAWACMCVHACTCVLECIMRVYVVSCWLVCFLVCFLYIIYYLFFLLLRFSSVSISTDTLVLSLRNRPQRLLNSDIRRQTLKILRSTQSPMGDHGICTECFNQPVSTYRALKTQVLPFTHRKWKILNTILTRGEKVEFADNQPQIITALLKHVLAYS